MPYLFIENYEAGLDTRKSRYTAPPGSLRVLENAHINRGKEIEVRKKFADFAELPADTFGLHEVLGQLYVFGSAAAPSMPATVEYQQLVSASAGNMTRIWDTENFNGKIYAIAEFDTGEVQHFYDTAIVTDWDALAIANASVESVALALGRRIESDPTVTVEVREDTLTLTGPAGTAFTLSTAVVGGAGTITNANLQAAVAAAPEVLATCSFEVTGGSVGPTFNTLGPITVDGVDIIGDEIDYDTDNDTTAAAVAARITAYAGTAHTATSAGPVVTITAPTGTGASPNGQVLSVTPNGTVTVGSVTNMAGGADPVTPVPQIDRVQVTAHDNTTLYQVVIDGATYQILGQASYIPLFCRTHKDKMYAGVTSLLYFSGFNGGVPNPMEWNGSGASPSGDGFINLATKARGAEEAVAVGIYQDKIAAYTRQSVQLWNVDPDPDLNSLYQVLYNVGAEAPGSVVEYGDVDLFNLDRSGIRSLRARDSSNLAGADDVGVAIDDDLVPYKNGLSQDVVRNARGVLEPEDGRYLLALGERVYVFSNFPGSRVSAWSTYDLGGTVEWWAATSTRLYARIGDQVYLYGGLTGIEYDGVSATVETPHLDANNPGTGKQFTRLDMGITGTWTVEMSTEPDDDVTWEEVGVFDKSTYGSALAAGMTGRGTHIALRLQTTTTGRTILGNTIIHFDEVDRW